MIQKQQKIIGIFIVLIVFIPVYISVLWYFRNSKKPHAPNNQPPEAIPVARDPYFEQFVPKDASPSSLSLTQQEQLYPTGLPQKFPGMQSTETGNVIITSDIDAVRIIITTKNPGDADISDQTQYAAPPNNTPVRIILPANYYTVIAEKDRYVWKWIPVVVEPNKITRLQVHLDTANIQY